ncbi:HdeD family acid-resistance protein [Fulvivirga sedimenti]|uniref:HdeD family acid-resistance protein n=1 Tax=Fulvivirga sedimenti TaxID=2879465 RepID=A0A9X1HQD6_9BACT|nr:HdeD family acid-resistance protein [Fulvivirga sedimenti]MCA6074704.1 HdeD family acid-resistance protein [Fulvivirga sedimenti]MCA6075881.1 HdeD family acid-resistance protein [Fulvivirga sedimenti]MCA6077009.1 HdeD family acid-resistance protein [Fulvivirga sedimenti]
MKSLFTLNWWVWLLRGLLFVVFGIIAFVSPVVTAATLAIWFAAFLFIDGVFALIHTFRHWKDNDDKWLMFAEAAISIVLGILLIRNPSITLLYVSLMLAFWFIYSGVVKIGLAIQVRKEIKGEGWLIAGGAVSVILGIVLLARPDMAIAGLIGLLAFFAIVMGILMIVISFKIRKGSKWIENKVDHAREKIEDAREAFEQRGQG